MITVLAIDIPFPGGIISFDMHTTFAHISVATEADMNLPSLFSQVAAHEETWEGSTIEQQVYVTTIEYQHTGIDERSIAGREHRTGPGTFSIFADGTRIETEHIRPGEPNRVEYLRLRGSIAAAIERTLGVDTDRPMIMPDAPVSIGLILTQAAQAVFQRPPNWPWRLSEVLGELTRTVATARALTTTPATDLVDHVRTLIEESPHHPWSVKEVSDMLGVRREMLWSMFKHRTGQSPGDWIRRHRMLVAQTMLARGLSVRQTAERLGFSSRQQFARSYRTLTGHAPSRR